MECVGGDRDIRARGRRGRVPRSGADRETSRGKQQPSDSEREPVRPIALDPAQQEKRQQQEPDRVPHQPYVAETSLSEQGTDGLHGQLASVATSRDERLASEVDQPRAHGHSGRDEGECEQAALERVEARAGGWPRGTEGRRRDEDEEREDAGHEARSANLDEPHEERDEVPNVRHAVGGCHSDDLSVNTYVPSLRCPSMAKICHLTR